MEKQIQELDVVSLASETKLNAVSGVILIDRLVSVAPHDLTGSQRKALTEMESAKSGISLIREDRAMRAPAKVRPYLTRFTGEWSGVSSILAAHAAIPAGVGGERAEKAQALRELLFPESGTPYLNVDSETAYLEGRERLERLEANAKMKRELVALVGAEHLVALEKVTKELGEILGIGGHQPQPLSHQGMVQALRVASRAIARYARLLLADLDEDDPASMLRFRTALAPLAEHKASWRNGNATSDDASDGDVASPSTPEAETPSPTPAVDAEHHEA